MARGGTDWLNLASNVKQERRLAQIQQQQEQQNLMMMMHEVNRQNIIEKRKMVVNFDQFADKAAVVSNAYPAYAIMMTDLAIEAIDSAGLNADTFEEITDMERVNQMNSKIRGNEANMKSSASPDTVSSAHQMRVFIEEGDGEMEALAPMCEFNEDWAEHADEFAEVDPLHQDRKSKYRMWSLGPLLMGVILVFAYVGLLGECIETDAENICTTYENETNTVYSIGALGILVFCCGLILGLALFPWSRKYLKQWKPLNEKKQRVEGVQEEYNYLSQKYGLTSSQQVIDRRLSMIAWVAKMSPTDPSMRLEL